MFNVDLFYIWHFYLAATGMKIITLEIPVTFSAFSEFGREEREMQQKFSILLSIGIYNNSVILLSGFKMWRFLSETNIYNCQKFVRPII